MGVLQHGGDGCRGSSDSSEDARLAVDRQARVAELPFVVNFACQIAEAGTRPENHVVDERVVEALYRAQRRGDVNDNGALQEHLRNAIKVGVFADDHVVIRGAVEVDAAGSSRDLALERGLGATFGRPFPFGSMDCDLSAGRSQPGCGDTRRDAAADTEDTQPFEGFFAGRGHGDRLTHSIGAKRRAHARFSRVARCHRWRGNFGQHEIPVALNNG